MNPTPVFSPRRKLGSPKFHVAPMVDASELTFRMLCRKHGAEAAYTPMIHSRLFVEDKNYRELNFKTAEGDRPLFIQFCANDPAVFLEAGRLVQGQASEGAKSRDRSTARLRACCLGAAMLSGCLVDKQDAWPYEGKEKPSRLRFCRETTST